MSAIVILNEDNRTVGRLLSDGSEDTATEEDESETD